MASSSVVAQRLRVDPPGLEVGPRARQLRGAQQAADVVGTKGGLVTGRHRHSLLLETDSARFKQRRVGSRAWSLATGQSCPCPVARGCMTTALIARLPQGMTSLAILLLVRTHTGSYAAAGIAVGAYDFATAAGAPLVGRLVDRFGRRRVLGPGAVLQTLVLVALVAGRPRRRRGGAARRRCRRSPAACGRRSRPRCAPCCATS